MTTFGAPSGGVTMTGLSGFDSSVVRPIVPSNFFSGIGRKSRMKSI